jgi:hypothetical protein
MMTVDNAKARLKKIADIEGKDFNYILMHHFFTETKRDMTGFDIIGVDDYVILSKGAN